MAVSLEDFARQLEPGPFWITGEFMQAFCDVLIADRARAGSNMDEQPSPKGRFLNPKAAGAGAASTPTPFQLLQVDSDGDARPGENVFTFNPNSFFRQDPSSLANTGITGIDAEYALADGDILYLQLDAAKDGTSLDEASVVKDQTGPGSALITWGGSGTASEPYIWDESFVLLAQVFAADAGGQAVRGGVVYTVDALTPPTRVEVVQQTWTHLSLQQVLAGRRIGCQAFPDAAPLLS